MRRILLFVGLLAGLLVVISQSVQSRSEQKTRATPDAEQGQEQAGAKPSEDRSADEAAIRKNVAAFVRAYNAGDAKAVAALFTPDGLIIDKEGDTAEGREAIERAFAGLFA